ncbi:MAG: ATP-binding protein [Clostridia bacterium]|nr:ATP-binding protein [Clostridia bacterium]
MFKSIRWKITAYFVLLVITAQLIGGVAALSWTAKYFRTGFENAVTTVFSDDLKAELTEAANGVSPTQPQAGAMVIEENPAENLETIKSIMNLYTAGLSLGMSRFYAVLDSSGKVLYSSSNATQTEHTPVLVSALNGMPGMETGMSASYMDYALPLMNGSQVKFVIYVKDSGDDASAVVGRIYDIMLYSLLIAAAAALVMGYFLSRSVSVPLKSLTVNAKRLADGDLNALTPSQADDELGELTNSLVYLAHSRQESTEQAISEKVKIETILQNMNDGILAFDISGKLIHVNPEAKRLLQRKYLDDIRFDRFFKEINANISLGDLLYMKPETAVEREIKLNNQYLQLNFAVFNSDNKIGGIIVIIHDVTKQERLEASRRDFVADVSHELRTPLTIIKSYADILADTPDADRELRTRFLGTISSETDRMTRIISDLLTLSKLDENQTYDKTPEEIDIRAMIETIVERFALTARKREQKLTYHPINEVPKIMGDRDGLERAIVNIVSNALKYTPTGGHVEIYTSKVYKDINIKISDNGIGIPKDKLPNIFDRFFRVEKARSRDKGGTGLGLAIAKQTIESAFNGKIKITSEVNKGSDFVITIPVEE